MDTYYSNGKLLISGEYAVLDGALSLAVPTRFGQWMRVMPIEKPEMSWASLDYQDKIWFETKIPMLDLLDETTKSMDAYEKPLRELLRAIAKLNPNLLSKTSGFEVETKLNFPRDWGLGSSSTLVNNLAQWAGVNPYQLLETSFGGSGYDLACAGSKMPVLYQLIDGKPMVSQTVFSPDFSNQLFFVHLNKKQNSRDGIKRYRLLSEKNNLVQEVTELTLKMIKTESLKDFSDLMDAHESLIAKVVQLPKVKDMYFSDYPGSVKSLGAWGGDFVLAAGDLSSPEYFNEKGFTTVIPFKEMML